MKAIIWIGAGSIMMILLAGLLAPLVLRSRKRPNSTQALSNARQIGLALFDFDTEYGRFPDASTLPLVKVKAHSDWDLKNGTSNDLFKQLIVSGICNSEEIFYAKVPGARKPDNVMSSEAKTLTSRECGFAYIGGATSGCMSSRPLVIAPLIPGTLKCDPVPFDGKAVILRADNSAVSYQIRPDGAVIGPGGKDLFDPSQPYWAGAPPDVKWADLPPSPLPATPSDRLTAWVVALVGIVVMVLVASIGRGRRLLQRKSPPPAVGSV